MNKYTNNMKKALAAVLIFVLVFGLAGCVKLTRKDSPQANGGGNTSTEQTTTASTEENTTKAAEETTTAQPASADVSGIYIGKYKLTEEMEKQAEMDFKTDFFMELSLEFLPENRYTIYMDVSRFIEGYRKFMEAEYGDMLRKLFEDEGVSDSELPNYLKEIGYDSFEAFLAAAIEEGMKSVEEEYAGKNTTVSSGKYTQDGDALIFEAEENDGSTIDSGKINSDGSISIPIHFADGSTTEITFEK